MRRIIVSIDLDYFFAQCEEVRRPEIKGRPAVVCVYSGRTEDSGVVSAANYIARSFGVKSGIPIVLAKKLLSRSSGAVFLPVDLEHYRSVSDRIMQIIRLYSPVFERVSIDEAFIDVTSKSGLDYNVAESGAAEMKEMIKEEVSLTCTIGVAPNKLLAKMVAETKKPDGLAVLKPQDVKSFLGNLPIGKLLGVGPKIEARMKMLGISNVGELSDFEEPRLSAAFGRKSGLRFKLIANGIDEEPVSERVSEQYSRIMTLKNDAYSFSFAEELGPLARDISKHLKEVKRKCKNIGIIFVTDAIKIGSRSRKLDKWTDSEEEIADCASELFDQLFKTEKPGGLKIRRIGLRVSRLSDESADSESSRSLSDYV